LERKIIFFIKKYIFLNAKRLIWSQRHWSLWELHSAATGHIWYYEATSVIYSSEKDKISIFPAIRFEKSQI